MTNDERKPKSRNLNPCARTLAARQGEDIRAARCAGFFPRPSHLYGVSPFTRAARAEANEIAVSTALPGWHGRPARADRASDTRARRPCHSPSENHRSTCGRQAAVCAEDKSSATTNHSSCPTNTLKNAKAWFSHRVFRVLRLYVGRPSHRYDPIMAQPGVAQFRRSATCERSEPNQKPQWGETPTESSDRFTSPIWNGLRQI